jgi:hypothetical protein
VHPVAGQTAARSVTGDLLRALTVNLGVGGIAQPQLDASAELILQRGSDFRPPRRRQQHVYTERKSLSRHGGDRGFERLELATQARPAVDDEEYLTERVVVLGLARSDDGFHLGDHAADQLRLGPSGDRAHMWQGTHRCQLSAAEVKTVKLHPIRIVGGRQRRDEGAQRRRLA